jgi:hypothetical protein
MTSYRYRQLLDFTQRRILYRQDIDIINILLNAHQQSLSSNRDTASASPFITSNNTNKKKKNEEEKEKNDVIDLENQQLRYLLLHDLCNWISMYSYSHSFQESAAVGQNKYYNPLLAIDIQETLDCAAKENGIKQWQSPSGRKKIQSMLDELRVPISDPIHDEPDLY